MKFKSYLFAGMAIFAMASCNEDFGDWVSQKSNEQEAVGSMTNISVTAVPNINFADIAEDTERIKIVDMTPVSSTDPSISAPTYQVVFNGDSPFELQEDGTISFAELKEYVESTFGRRPVARTIEAKIIATMTAAVTEDVNNTFHAFSDKFNITATPVAPVIEEAYYYVGATNGWNGADMTYKLTNGGGDVYDDPVFTCTVPAPFNADGTRADNWMKIAPASAYALDDFWSCPAFISALENGDGATEGKFTLAGSDGGAWNFPASDGAVAYRLSFNMLDQTYTITPLTFGDYFYEIGNESGWSTAHPLYGPNGDGKYQGYYYLNGEFKFKPNEGDWNDDLEYVSGDALGGTLQSSGGPNCPDPGAGFYQIDLDAAGLTYSLVKVNSISIIGTVNGNWDTDTDLTYNVETGAWEITTELAAGNMKFRMNHDWTISWGGANGDPTAFDNLTQNNGKDLAVEAGTYKIQLFIAYEGNNKVVMTKQ